jgi:(p)ppGpp synthase/HD superfamily hydrolase
MTTSEQEIRALGQTLAFAADVHKDDIYGQGPYVYHLLQVLKTVQGWGESINVQILAAFHDAIEDHPDKLAAVMAFLWTIRHVVDYTRLVTSLEAITRHFHGKETYNEYLDRVILDEDATIVKLADLQRNSAPKEHRSEKHIKLALERYIPAMAKVTKALLARERAH